MVVVSVRGVETSQELLFVLNFNEAEEIAEIGENTEEIGWDALLSLHLDTIHLLRDTTLDFIGNKFTEVSRRHGGLDFSDYNWGGW